MTSFSSASLSLSWSLWTREEVVTNEDTHAGEDDELAVLNDIIPNGMVDSLSFKKPPRTYWRKKYRVPEHRHNQA